MCLYLQRKRKNIPKKMSVVGRSRGGEKKCFRLVGRSGGGEKKNNKNKSGVGEEKNCNKKEFVGSSVGWAVRRQRRTKWGKNCVGWSVDQSRKNQSCTLVEGRWAGAEVRLLFGLNSAVKKISCPKASNGQRFPCPAQLLFLNETFFVFLGGG